MGNDDKAKQVEQLLEVPNLADALESDRFKQFLDHIPFAVAVSDFGLQNASFMQTLSSSA